MDGMLHEMANILDQIKAKKPLVHHMTNTVTINDCANITLAVGASPVMANDINEVEEMASRASALVLNIGTLNSEVLESMLAAGKEAARRKIPIVFDPVGVGATSFRSAATARILQEVRPSVVRGNMSEIKMLAGIKTSIKGVDSTADEKDGEIVAVNLARQLNCVVAVTGVTDIVADTSRVCRIHNGHPMLSRVTGTGCMATSLIASCCAAANNHFGGAAAGLVVMGIAGEIAHGLLKPEDGVGSYRMRLFDAVYNMTPAILVHRAKLS